MASRYEQHQLIVKVQELARTLGRPPSRAEFCAQMPKSRGSIIEHFKTYTSMLEAAALVKKEMPIAQERSFLAKYKSLCLRKEQIQGFFRHTLDLNEMFRRAGNPRSLKMVAQPDTHAKFMDIPAINALIKFLHWYNPDVYGILGDLSDCEGLSHWPTSDLEPRRIVPEMKTTRLLLDRISVATPKAHTRFFCTGNHEDWIFQAMGRMPEMFEGLEDLGIEISPEKLMGLDKHGYEIFPLNHLVKIGNAHFTHGIFTGTHHAKKHLDTFKASIYYGHLHDLQEHNQTSMDGHMEAVSLGCLCRLDAKFLKGRPNNWVHAFGVFEFFPDGTYTFFKPRILNGKFSMHGQVFDGNS